MRAIFVRNGHEHKSGDFRSFRGNGSRAVRTLPKSLPPSTHPN